MSDVLLANALYGPVQFLERLLRSALDGSIGVCEKLDALGQYVENLLPMK